MERLNQKNGIDLNMTKPSDTINVVPQNIGTPEIYFGYQFDRGNLGYQGLKPNAVADFKFNPSPIRNFVYLDGRWRYNADNMELVGDDGSVFLIYRAKDVNIVAGSDSNSTAVIFFDNDFLNGKNKGLDITVQNNKSISNVNEFKLYNLVSGQDYGEHIIQIDALGRGFKIYTFTFG